MTTFLGSGAGTNVDRSRLIVTRSQHIERYAASGAHSFVTQGHRDAASGPGRAVGRRSRRDFFGPSTGTRLSPHRVGSMTHAVGDASMAQPYSRRQMSSVACPRHLYSAFRAGHPGWPALLLPQILPVSSVVAPCQPGAALRNPLHNSTRDRPLRTWRPTVTTGRVAASRPMAPMPRRRSTTPVSTTSRPKPRPHIGAVGVWIRRVAVEGVEHVERNEEVLHQLASDGGIGLQPLPAPSAQVRVGTGRRHRIQSWACRTCSTTI